MSLHETKQEITEEMLYYHHVRLFVARKITSISKKLQKRFFRALLVERY